MKIQTSTKESTDFERPHIQEGLYQAKLKEVKDIADGQYGARMVFIYTVEGKDLPFVCYKTKATRDNKLGQTLMAHGVEIKNQEIELDSLIGTSVKVLVEDYSYEIDAVAKVASTISKVKPVNEALEKKPFKVLSKGTL